MPLKVLPSDEELTDFEKSYAGPQTEQLEKRFAELRENCDGPFDVNCNLTICPTHDHHCLVGLELIDFIFDDDLRYWERSRSLMRCDTCTRVMHMNCTAAGDPKFNWCNSHCVLCQKRAWHIVEPLAAFRAGLHGDDLVMASASRKAQWEEEVGTNEQVKEWSTLYDDGSLRSDRQLLVDLGMVEPQDSGGTEESNDNEVRVHEYVHPSLETPSGTSSVPSSYIPPSKRKRTC